MSISHIYFCLRCFFFFSFWRLICNSFSRLIACLSDCQCCCCRLSHLVINLWDCAICNCKLSTGVKPHLNVTMWSWLGQAADKLMVMAFFPSVQYRTHSRLIFAFEKSFQLFTSWAVELGYIYICHFRVWTEIQVLINVFFFEFVYVLTVASVCAHAIDDGNRKQFKC